MNNETSNVAPADSADNEDIELLVIHEAARQLAQASTPDIAIHGILRLMSQMVGLNRGRVVLPDEQGGMRIQYAYGLTEDERQRGQYALGEGVTGRVMRSGQIAVIQNIDDEPIYLTRAVERATLPQETVSFLAVPILHDNTPMGVLGAHRLRQRKRAFSRDITLLRILATLIAQILRLNALIEEKTARLADENRALKQALEEHSEGAHGILGDSPALKHALRQALHVAPTVATVLLTGESGTGKERFARMVHLDSQRCDGPFMAINCAAIPENLLESELFGHEKGAFTGAVATKKGVVELASGGTLFLDEIGDLAFDLQSKLLHVLERQLIKRVGGAKDIPVDVRIIAATHKNLQKAVNEGRFRIDLFYRLNVFPIHLPPLRERSGDVRSLARHFLQAANQEFDRNTMFGAGVLERLEHYNWPGNIRQLENVIKRAVLVTQDGQIKLDDIILILRHEANIGEHLEAGMALSPSGGALAAPPPAPHAPEARPDMREEISPPPRQTPMQPINLRGYNWVREDEAQELLDALKQARGNKTRAAGMLGMSARQFRYRMVKLGLGDGGE
ncbi:MAG: sigma 54-interacting transcriptional regulator [Pseudomonadota bacterium]